MPHFVSYAKYVFDNDNDNYWGKKLPNQNSIRVNRTISVMLANYMSGIGNMKSVRVLHGVLEKIEKRDTASVVIILYYG